MRSIDVLERMFSADQLVLTSPVAGAAGASTLTSPVAGVTGFEGAKKIKFRSAKIFSCQTHMFSEELAEALKDFSVRHSIDQRDLVESAIIDFMLRYGGEQTTNMSFRRLLCA